MLDALQVHDAALAVSYADFRFFFQRAFSER